MSNSPADTKITEEGGRGSAPDAGAEIALKPMEKPMVEKVWVMGDTHWNSLFLKNFTLWGRPTLIP